MSFFRYIHSCERFARTFAIVTKQYILYLSLRIGLIPGTGKEKEITAATFTRKTLEKLGSTFIKFGQFLSIRPDLVPPSFCEEFRKLQDKVPPFSFDKARSVIESELKVKYTRVFSEFDEVPVASASVSQVHRARLTSGEEVAVKVQRPGIRKEMEADISIMAFLAYLVERFIPRFRKNRPRMLVKEFSKWTGRELDFYQEAKNAAHFHYHFKDNPGVKFPEVYLKLTTQKVFVMEFIQGLNILEAPEDAMDKHVVAHLITESMLKQIFQDGFFHGDPHPGNIFLLQENTIAYLDFGIVGYLSKELREWSFDILFGMAEGDISRVIDSFIEICNVREEDVNVPEYRRQINEVLADLHVYEICDIPFSSMLEKFLNTSLDYGIDVPSDFVIMSKAIATLEGTCLSLAPEIKIVDYLKPYVKKYLIVEPDLDTFVENLKKGPYEMGRWKRLISRHLGRMLDRFEQSTFRLESDEFSNIVRQMEKASVNISYGVIIAALIIFAAALSNDTAFERWLRSLLNLPKMPILPIISLALAAFASLRLYLRQRTGRRKR